MNANFKMKYLTGGDDLFGPNMGAAVVNTTVRKGYLDECPNVGKLVKQLQVRSRHGKRHHGRRSSTRMPIRKWPPLIGSRPIRTPSIRGFNGVTTFDGKGPALDAVKKGLGL